MRRRGFLASAATVAAAPLLPAKALALLLPAVPILYGDGVHDDSAALEAALNGRPCNWPDGRPTGNAISRGRFRLNRTIVISERGGSLTDSFIDYRPNWEAP